MDSKSTSNVLQPEDPAYERYCHPLKDDLGLHDEAVEIIVNLRNQVIVLHTRLHALESTLEIHQIRHRIRLTRYREIFQEADWEDT